MKRPNASHRFWFVTLRAAVYSSIESCALVRITDELQRRPLQWCDNLMTDVAKRQCSAAPRHSAHIGVMLVSVHQITCMTYFTICSGASSGKLNLQQSSSTYH